MRIFLVTVIALGLGLSSGQANPVRLPDLALFLEQSLPLIKADQANALGFTGAGQTVLVIDFFSSDGHGQWVSEIIRGVAPGVTIQMVDLDQMSEINPFETAFNNRLQGYRAINMSFGTVDPILQEPIIFPSPCKDFDSVDEFWFEQLNDEGIVLVAAAGNALNRNGLEFPACHRAVLSVGATNDLSFSEVDLACPATVPKLDELACFSNEASFMDLVAPGMFVTTSITGSNPALSSGTSASAPLVTGAIVLMLQANPNLTPNQIEAILEKTGVTALSPFTGRSYPRLNVLAAVQEAQRLNNGSTQNVDEDINGDGQVTVDDAIEYARRVFGLSMGLTPDINGDGTIDIDDAIEIARRAFGLG